MVVRFGNGDDGCYVDDEVVGDKALSSTYVAIKPGGACHGLGYLWSEMSGDGGGGGKARSFSTSSSDGK
ncbi:hypothetical protein Tco_0570705 [Tanacetum coccineum]